MDSRVVSGKHIDEDLVADASLRPKRLSEYIGQDRVKETLSVFIEAALARGEALDHMLLYGPPGLEIGRASFRAAPTTYGGSQARG